MRKNSRHLRHLTVLWTRLKSFHCPVLVFLPQRNKIKSLYNKKFLGFYFLICKIHVMVIHRCRYLSNAPTERKKLPKAKRLSCYTVHSKIGQRKSWLEIRIRKVTDQSLKVGDVGDRHFLKPLVTSYFIGIETGNVINLWDIS